MISYVSVLPLVIIQIITGFALWYPDAMGWLTYGLFNNEIQVRLAHYIVTWAFVLFLMIHIYLSIREGLQEMKDIHLVPTEEKE
jgi:Ni/Fe-hydrogenase 1 B-type cytochrome subunit